MVNTGFDDGVEWERDDHWGRNCGDELVKGFLQLLQSILVISFLLS